MAEILNKVMDLFTFIARKINDFPNLSLGEQIAFPAIGLGLLLILLSLVFFII